MDNEQNENSAWIERIKDLITMLEGSTISEMELTEAGTEIIIRRQPGMMMVSMPQQQVSIAQAGGGAPGALAAASTVPAARPPREDHTVPIAAPLTGLYYSSPSPTSPPFINVGEVVHVGQIVALIEAMKVFNEIQAEVSGRVVKILATNGDVVQKGDPLMRVEPL